LYNCYRFVHNVFIQTLLKSVAFLDQDGKAQEPIRVSLQSPFTESYNSYERVMSVLTKVLRIERAKENIFYNYFLGYFDY